ncbi:MAG: hypothetical protein AAGA68_23050 [Pseudomonadota bacterium]
MSIEIFAVVGFLLAAYSIVANDAIQTLGTFLSSNSNRPWWVLWLYASSIIVAIMVWGFFTLDGDIAFGRLNTIPYPQTGIQWWHAVPPLFLLALTQLGIPVSTTFMVLTMFAVTGGAATEGVLQSMLTKSALGWLVAFASGALLYALISRTFERWIRRTGDRPPGVHWAILQWSSTAFLWSQWLMQDLANIFIYLPRETVQLADGVQVSFTPTLLLFATGTMLVLHAYVFATRGGEIQKIVLTKTHTTDIRAATLIDFVYGCVLFYFKQLNDIPMSTTWVFLGLLAGRELAIAVLTDLRGRRAALKDVGTDVVRAMIGLLVSVALAFGMPWIANGELPRF